MRIILCGELSRAYSREIEASRVVAGEIRGKKYRQFECKLRFPKSRWKFSNDTQQCRSIEDSGVNAFTPRSQRLRNRLCIGPSVRHASFIPLVTSITADIYMHTYVRNVTCTNWIWLDRVAFRDIVDEPNVTLDFLSDRNPR